MTGTITAIATFDWCIACEERPAHDNSLLCSECDQELPFTVGDFLAVGVDRALEIALERLAERKPAA